ncbi:MAG: hypothetical protein U0573_04630 [Phycisphaerales bacterium]|nr:hypothetical protein [Planctomycetota bacterium]
MAKSELRVRRKAKPPKSQMGLQHEKLRDAKTMEKAKVWQGDRAGTLQKTLT